MSTNYYAVLPSHEGACEHCALMPEVHIGKRLYHWSLRAYTDGPFGAIQSWADWRRALITTLGVMVRDEYGQFHTPEWLIATVDSDPQSRYFPETEDRRRIVTTSRAVSLAEGTDWWFDPDGFLMVSYEFR